MSYYRYRDESTPDNVRDLLVAHYGVDKERANIFASSKTWLRNTSAIDAADNIAEAEGLDEADCKDDPCPWCHAPALCWDADCECGEWD